MKNPAKTCIDLYVTWENKEKKMGSSWAKVRKILASQTRLDKLLDQQDLVPEGPCGPRLLI